MAQEKKSFLVRVRGVLHGPILVGVIAALIAIGLSVFGMVRNPEATPLNVRSLLLVVVLAGGSWDSSRGQLRQLRWNPAKTM
jgi:hypothetical protein